MARQPGNILRPVAETGGGPGPFRRAALLLEYDGTAYEGLQRQPGAATIAGTLEEAVRRIGGPADPGFRAAGRTDAGVHAMGQVVAVDVPERIPPERLALALNANLPHDIRVRRAVPCAPEFDPRRHAVRRTYVYRYCAGEPVAPLWRHQVAYFRWPAPEEALARALACYRGTHDFRAWRSSSCQARRTVLTVERAELLPEAPDPVLPPGHRAILVVARSFLHHMVRFLVGGAMAVGQGRLTAEELAEALRRGERPGSVVPAPACGLVLQRVDYPPDRDPFLANPR